MNNLEANQLEKICPAQRISCVEEYYFSVKLKEIAKMNAEGANIINLGIGSPDLPPSKDVIDALCNEAKLESAHGYQSYVGIPQLREAFANWYYRFYNVQLDSTCEILPLMGSKEGIMHISMAFLNEGDGVLIPNPGYPTYSSVAKLVGAKIVNYNLTESNNWYPDFDALEEADAKGKISLKDIKLMWCNYPNMPTGANSSLELFEKLVAFGKKYSIVICHDNPYSFVLTQKPLSILEIEGAKDICIELNSLSKSSNMSGWRIGMVGSNRNFIEWILRVKSNMDSGMFKPLQVAAVKALEAPESWYKDMNAVYSHRKELAIKIMRAVGAEPRERQVGLFLWGKVVNENLTGIELADKVLYESKVFITPGAIFGSEGNNYIRISLCANENTLKEALSRIENKK